MLSFRARYERAAAGSFAQRGEKLISDLLLRYFIQAFTPLSLPLKSEIFNKNQTLGNQAKTHGYGALLQKKSLKDVTDEQLVHRLAVFSGIIAPPYDRVRKPS
jgi:hypothetical protein